MSTYALAGLPVTRNDFPEIRWNGHWIWVPEDKIAIGNVFGGDAPARPESHGLFRKMFDLDAVPVRVPARISADSRYVLFVNGQEVRRGPIRSQPRRLHYDLFDLAPYLCAGLNTLAVYVKYFGKATAGWIPAVANGTLGKTGVLVFEANLDERWLVSDGSWRARQSDAWSADGYDGDASNPITGGVPTECFDARTLTPGWQNTQYDDASCGAAQVIVAAHRGHDHRSNKASRAQLGDSAQRHGAARGNHSARRPVDDGWANGRLGRGHPDRQRRAVHELCGARRGRAGWRSRSAAKSFQTLE